MPTSRPTLYPTTSIKSRCIVNKYYIKLTCKCSRRSTTLFTHSSLSSTPWAKAWILASVAFAAMFVHFELPTWVGSIWKSRLVLGYYCSCYSFSRSCENGLLPTCISSSGYCSHGSGTRGCRGVSRGAR